MTDSDSPNKFCRRRVLQLSTTAGLGSLTGIASGRRTPAQSNIELTEVGFTSEIATSNGDMSQATTEALSNNSPYRINGSSIIPRSDRDHPVKSHLREGENVVYQTSSRVGGREINAKFDGVNLTLNNRLDPLVRLRRVDTGPKPEVAIRKTGKRIIVQSSDKKRTLSSGSHETIPLRKINVEVEFSEPMEEKYDIGDAPIPDGMVANKSTEWKEEISIRPRLHINDHLDLNLRERP